LEIEKISYFSTLFFTLQICIEVWKPVEMSDKPKYKLTYFNMRGLAEPIRYIFAYLDIPYEDKRIEQGDEWNNIKSDVLLHQDYPWGNMPVLKENDFVLCQSHAIVRYLGHKYNLTGANLQENAKCDEYLDAIKDYFYEFFPLFREKDESKKQEIKEKIAKEATMKFFPKFNKDLEANGGEFIVGKKVTYADFLLFHYFSQSMITLGDDIFDEYPAIDKYMENMFRIPNIKKWMAKRPNTMY